MRALLEPSATARSVLGAIEDLPTHVRFSPAPPADASAHERDLATNWAWYAGIRNRITIPHAFIEPPATSGEAAHVTEVENAALVLHEARHREQAGRYPRLNTLLGVALDPARAVGAGVRQLHAGGSFLDGFDASTMRGEIDAYQVQLRTMRELHPAGAHPGEELPATLLAHLRDTGEYATRIWGQRVTAATGVGLLGAGIGWGGVHAVRAQAHD
jgi:hypothetical protein